MEDIRRFDLCRPLHGGGDSVPSDLPRAGGTNELERHEDRYRLPSLSFRWECRVDAPKTLGQSRLDLAEDGLEIGWVVRIREGVESLLHSDVPYVLPFQDRAATRLKGAESLFIGGESAEIELRDRVMSRGSEVLHDTSSRCVSRDRFVGERASAREGASVHRR